MLTLDEDDYAALGYGSIDVFELATRLPLERLRRWAASPAGKASKKRYLRSPEGCETNKLKCARYSKSAKGRAAAKRYYEKNKEKYRQRYLAKKQHTLTGEM
jgi:hypothetical protein